MVGGGLKSVSDVADKFAKGAAKKLNAKEFLGPGDAAEHAEMLKAGLDKTVDVAAGKILGTVLKKWDTKKNAAQLEKHLLKELRKDRTVQKKIKELRKKNKGASKKVA